VCSGEWWHIVRRGQKMAMLDPIGTLEYDDEDQPSYNHGQAKDTIEIMFFS
jgi:hypothetical protein